jgi:hypothetical protein
MTVKVSKPAINVREELADLRKPTGVAGEAMLRAETPQEQQALIGVGRRNVLINGSFNIYQRGSSGTVTAGLNYISDRWQHRGGNNVGGTTTYAQDVVDGTSRLKITYSGATGNAYIQQPIEAQNLYGMWNNYVTVSFYTTDEDPTVFAFGYNASGTESTMLPNTRPTYLGNNRWSHTFFLASPSGGPREGNAYGLGLVFYPNNQNPPANGTIEWWGMQFEKGSCATPFEHRSYGEELALCQRYYEVLCDGTEPLGYAAAWNSGGQSYISNGFMQTKRISNSTMSFTGDVYVFSATSGASQRTPTTGSLSDQRYEIVLTGGSVSGFARGYNSSTFIAADAEL